MKRLIDRLLGRAPPGYPVPVDARFDRTLVYEGSMRTAADLFGNRDGRPLGALVYHLFRFERRGRSYCFQVRDDRRAMLLLPDRRYRAYLDATGDRCWFEGWEGNAFPLPEPEGDERE